MNKCDIVIAHNKPFAICYFQSLVDGRRKSFVFRIAVQKMGLQPADVWFVGDKLEYDVRGALDSGLFPVWYNWRGELSSLDGDYLEVKELAQVRGKIEQLCHP